MIADVRPIEDAQPQAVEVAEFKKLLASGKAFEVKVGDHDHAACWRLCLADRRWPGVFNECWWGGRGVWYRVPARRVDGNWSR